MIKNKRKKSVIFLVSALIFLSFIPFTFSFGEGITSPINEDEFKQTITIQSFLNDMKANPEDYYLIVNRSQDEIDYMLENTSLKDFVDFFNIPVSSYFKDDGKNFVLIEIPTSYLGELFGLRKYYSYVEVYQDAFLQDMPYEYYLGNNWSVFNYTVIYCFPQRFPYNSETEEDFLKSSEEINRIDKDKDGFISESELALNWLDKIIGRLDGFSEDPINTDYLVLDEEAQFVELEQSERDFCPGYNSTNSIFSQYTYNLLSLEMKEECLDSKNVMELSCRAGSVFFQEIECPASYVCRNGACVSSNSALLSREDLILMILRWINNSSTISVQDIVRAILSLIFG